MGENFPNWQPGDDLLAAHMRKLAELALSGAYPGLASYFSGWNNTSLLERPIRIEVVIITAVIDNDLKTYQARPVWYDDAEVYGETTVSGGDPEWKDISDTDFEWTVDANAVGQTLTVGQKLAVYWHFQREAWVPVGGGGGSCTPQNAVLQVTVLGSPTGGTFDIILTVNAVTETLTFNWNDDLASAVAVIESHSQVGNGDITGSGGVFPNATTEFEFGGTVANTPIAVPLADWNALTGGSGVGVINSLAQLGISS